jgi:accessory gene regulator protein AgrB
MYCKKCKIKLSHFGSEAHIVTLLSKPSHIKKNDILNFKTTQKRKHFQIRILLNLLQQTLLISTEAKPFIVFGSSKEKT